jgi:hypothetical protein
MDGEISMIELVHHAAGIHIKTREQALADFWAHQRAANGGRRTDPEKFITVKQVRQRNSGSFDVFYAVPARILKKED